MGMPGHIKLVKGAVDPDPTEFLLPNMDMKKADQAKPYDPKASVWISNPKDGGYREGLLEVGNINLEDPAEKCTVAVGHEKFTMKAAEVGRVNPPKFEKCEDMVNLTYLNDASVFWNLKTEASLRYVRLTMSSHFSNLGGFTRPTSAAFMVNFSWPTATVRFSAGSSRLMLPTSRRPSL